MDDDFVCDFGPNLNAPALFFFLMKMDVFGKNVDSLVVEFSDGLAVKCGVDNSPSFIVGSSFELPFSDVA